MLLKIDNLKLSPGYSREALIKAVARKTGLPPRAITNPRLLRRSIDARRGEVHYVLSLCFEAQVNTPPTQCSPYEEENYTFPQPGILPLRERPIVIGAGPAGTYAAWVLAHCGYRPIILEQGEDIETRQRDVEAFFTRGTLRENSNIQFGEGGAGAFSDGKLVTRIRDSRCAQVMDTMARFTGLDALRYEAHPHVGSDKLVLAALRMREEITALGGEYRFGTRVEALVLKNNTITGVKTQKEILPASVVVLCCGNGARDLFENLYAQGVAMEAKAMAVGLRIEHPREYIDRLRYGSKPQPLLGAAEYHLRANVGERNVYSFCMCPGGVVVNASSEPEKLCVNGMSYNARDRENSNSALVVSVNKEDYGSDVLSGIAFQREIEEKAFLPGHIARVQTLENFMASRPGGVLGNVKPSILPGYALSDAGDCLPEHLKMCIMEGIRSFERSMAGFMLPDAVLTAAETRTSSPVRILRGEDLESLTVQGLYPAGEGAGYAGGITSSAVDGMRCAEAIVRKWRYTDGH